MAQSQENDTKKIEYQFTKNWFLGTVKNNWDKLLPQINLTRILEIGSYEGASTCYLIDMLSKHRDVEIHCVDTWQGGIEHSSDMAAVEKRFWHNINLSIANAAHKIDLICHKGYSDKELAKLLVQNKEGYFDFIYVDGSHQAPDVLCDAILSFKLLRKNGVLVFDDYLWSENLSYGVDPIRCPKPAIGAFTNIYCRKMRIIPAPLAQLYITKIDN